MKNLKNHLVICIFLLPFTLYSQIGGLGGLMGNDNSYISPGSGVAIINGTPVDYDKKRYEGVKGNPMLYKDWGKGFIVTRDTTNKQENNPLHRFARAARLRRAYCAYTVSEWGV